MSIDLELMLSKRYIHEDGRKGSKNLMSFDLIKTIIPLMKNNRSWLTFNFESIYLAGTNARKKWVFLFLSKRDLFIFYLYWNGRVNLKLLRMSVEDFMKSVYLIKYTIVKINVTTPGLQFYKILGT